MRVRLLVLISVTALAIIVLYARGPVPQDPHYHEFADSRRVLGIQNGCNVLSSILFAVSGAAGLALVLLLYKAAPGSVLLIEYALFFAGIFLTAFGSGYYHYNPANSSLVWDRLAMTIAFSALLSSVASECINRKAGGVLLAPLLFFGVFSVVYWIGTENEGHGDLRPYILVQFLTIILVALIVLLYRCERNYRRSIGWLALLYVIAKAFEIFDAQVFSVTRVVSGHTLKHLFAAAGTFSVIKMLYTRHRNSVWMLSDPESKSKKNH